MEIIQSCHGITKALIGFKSYWRQLLANKTLFMKTVMGHPNHSCYSFILCLVFITVTEDLREIARDKKVYLGSQFQKFQSGMAGHNGAKTFWHAGSKGRGWS